MHELRIHHEAISSRERDYRFTQFSIHSFHRIIHRDKVRRVRINHEVKIEKVTSKQIDGFDLESRIKRVREQKRDVKRHDNDDESIRRDDKASKKNDLKEETKDEDTTTTIDLFANSDFSDREKLIVVRKEKHDVLDEENKKRFRNDRTRLLAQLV